MENFIHCLIFPVLKPPPTHTTNFPSCCSSLHRQMKTINLWRKQRFCFSLITALILLTNVGLQLRITLFWVIISVLGCISICFQTGRSARVPPTKHKLLPVASNRKVQYSGRIQNIYLFVFSFFFQGVAKIIQGLLSLVKTQSRQSGGCPIWE